MSEEKETCRPTCPRPPAKREDEREELEMTVPFRSCKEDAQRILGERPLWDEPGELLRKKRNRDDDEEDDTRDAHRVRGFHLTINFV